MPCERAGDVDVVALGGRCCHMKAAGLAALEAVAVNDRAQRAGDTVGGSAAIAAAGGHWFTRSKLAPRVVINGSNTGKDVRTGAASSTVTGLVVAIPRQRNDIAMR